MLAKIDEAAKETKKILTKKLLDNYYEVNQEKGQEESHSEEQKMPSHDNPKVQTMDDTFVPEVQSVEPVEANVENADAGKEDEGKDKVENPSIDVVNPSTPKKNAEKEEMEVKVEVKSKAKDIVEIVKGKQVIDNPKFIQGPINLASLSPIQKIQLASFAQAKSNENLLKSHIEDSMFLTLATSAFEKLMPSFQKDTSDSPSG